MLRGTNNPPGKRSWQTQAIYDHLRTLKPGDFVSFDELADKTNVRLDYAKFLVCIRSARKQLRQADHVLFEVHAKKGLTRVNDGRGITIADKKRKHIVRTARVVVESCACLDESKLSAHEKAVQTSLVGAASIALAANDTRAVAKVATKMANGTITYLPSLSDYS